MLLGSAAMVVIMRIDYHWWRKRTNLVLGVAGLLHGAGAWCPGSGST